MHGVPSRTLALSKTARVQIFNLIGRPNMKTLASFNALRLVGVLLGGVLFAGLQGCASEPASEADADELGSTEADLTANAARLVGAFTMESSNAYPIFKGLVFQSDGTYFADVDTGIRCIGAPCPAGGRISGKYSATAKFLTLRAAAGTDTSFAGRYRYSLAIGRESGVQKITLSDHVGFASGWTTTVAKERSYCVAATDCDGQNLVIPKCIGTATCGADNRCGFKCGAPVFDVWPANATKLVAQTGGGGFTPPPPAGSTCTVGAAKYVLDVASRELSWDFCNWTTDGTPMHNVSGSRVLTAREVATITKAADAVKVTTNDICGADKPLLTISVTTPTSTRKYTDSFYACNGGNSTYVENIDGVFGAMRAAAR
jgi:hypothetical protein